VLAVGYPHRRLAVRTPSPRNQHLSQAAQLALRTSSQRTADAPHLVADGVSRR
jgi:hypothetical protein